MAHMICGLHFQGHARRETIEFDLLVLSNTVISFVVFRRGVKYMFGLFRLSSRAMSLGREAD